MKKLVILLTIGIFAIFFTGCNIDCPDCKSGDCAIECCPDQNEETASEVFIIVSPNQFNGDSGDIQIWEKELLGLLVVDEPITIHQDQEVFSYELDPGSYSVRIIGERFTSYANFDLPPNASTAVNVELLDSYTVEWIIDYRNDSPTVGTVSSETHLLWFEISHNWHEMLYLQGLSFGIQNPNATVTIDTCKIQIYTLAGWNDVSLPVNDTCTGCSNFQFLVQEDTLDRYLYIYPNSPHLFAFVCDISAAPSGANLQTDIMGFGFKNSYLTPFLIHWDSTGQGITF